MLPLVLSIAKLWVRFSSSLCLFSLVGGEKPTCGKEHLGRACFHFSGGSLRLNQTSGDAPGKTLSTWRSQRRPRDGSLDLWSCTHRRAVLTSRSAFEIMTVMEFNLFPSFPIFPLRCFHSKFEWGREGYIHSHIHRDPTLTRSPGNN